MNGFVAVTDPGWYQRLSREPGPRDANFWRPSTRAVNLPTGTPFFFKLKKPHHAIAGFGYFASFTVLPDWLAWETFGEANGVESLDGLRAKLQSIQEAARIGADPIGRIGCSLIAEARFFAPSDWVLPPSDWSRTTQTGNQYDLSQGEGRRIWEECQMRSSISAPDLTLRDHAPEARYGPPTLYVPRLGQAIFRIRVLDAYGRACAVTNEHSLPVLEAAHIRPYAQGGEHELPNGLVLRSDLHRLFDRGYVTVDDESRLVVGRRLKEHFDNGRSYYALHGSSLSLPANASSRPSREALAWHREAVFTG